MTTHNIKGKTYTEDEVISVYEYWRFYLDCEDINDAIEHVTEYGYDKELSEFMKVNTEMVRAKCIEHLALWHDIQSNTLNASDESVFDFALQLIDCIYYDQEGKLPR